MLLMNNNLIHCFGQDLEQVGNFFDFILTILCIIMVKLKFYSIQVLWVNNMMQHEQIFGIIKDCKVQKVKYVHKE